MYYVPVKTTIYGKPVNTTFFNSKGFVNPLWGLQRICSKFDIFLTVDVYTPNMGFYPSTQHTVFIFQKYTLFWIFWQWNKGRKTNWHTYKLSCNIGTGIKPSRTQRKLSRTQQCISKNNWDRAIIFVQWLKHLGWHILK